MGYVKLFGCSTSNGHWNTIVTPTKGMCDVTFIRSAEVRDQNGMELKGTEKLEDYNYCLQPEQPELKTSK